MSDNDTSRMSDVLSICKSLCRRLDFANAFLSFVHEFMWRASEAMELPDEMLHLIHLLYKEFYTEILCKGQTFGVTNVVQ